MFVSTLKVFSYYPIPLYHKTKTKLEEIQKTAAKVIILIKSKKKVNIQGPLQTLKKATEMKWKL